MAPMKLCVVCSKNTTLYNYGVFCCNACKMFFRRCIHPNATTIKPCKYDKTCYSNLKFMRRNCRACRFNRCLNSGMQLPTVSKEPRALVLRVDSDLSKLISQLSVLNISREFTMENCHFPENLTMEELFQGQELVKFTKKPKGTVYNAMDWGFMEQITCIDFMRKFDFMANLKTLSPVDYTLLMRDTFFQWSSLTIAWRNYTEKRDVVMFHGQFDIFPENIVADGGISRQLMQRMRSQVIAKLIQLQLTEEEFMLLSVVLFCNPSIPLLSDIAISHLSAYQQTYASALRQYCFMKYQRYGPSRFADLLSLCHVINANFKDCTQYFILLQLCYPKNESMRKLYSDLFKYRF